MRASRALNILKGCLGAGFLLAGLLAARPAHAAGVTIITHGLNGDVDGWITAMANSIPNYWRFAGTNFTIYEMEFVPTINGFVVSASRVAGSQPFAPESGEIIVKLDWRQLADGASSNTVQIARAVVPSLMNTNFIPELGGHALAEWPLHLIGHSRGGSLMSEMSRQLGTNGVWVDHLTTLDPHPLNNDGFNDFIYPVTDAPVRTYVNVLFHDNYYQTASFPIIGEPVFGAYVRELTNFSGGYSGLGSQHSDTHLWYHGTVNSNTPTSYADGSTITIDASMRTNWWTTYESRGNIAGFYYSLIGDGDRLSAAQPAGAGTDAIVSGYNQFWDLGAGTVSNRTVLGTNYGYWPNLIRFDRASSSPVVQDQSTPVTFYYQWARPATSNATIQIYLDDDLNPLNTNQVLLKQLTVPATGASFVSVLTTNITLSASNATPGLHAFFASISGGGRTRYLYAPDPVDIISKQPPVLDIANLGAGQYQIGINGQPGQTIVLQHSTNLLSWLPLATNTLATSRWVYPHTPPPGLSPRYYRAVFTP